MTFARRLAAPTKTQKARFDAMKEAGCVVARLRGMGWVGCEIHHITSYGRTISHDHTICLNPWSHRGVPFNGWTANQCREWFGPSLARGSKPFHAEFGSDEELLAMQNASLTRGEAVELKR